MPIRTAAPPHRRGQHRIVGKAEGREQLLDAIPWRTLTNRRGQRPRLIAAPDQRQAERGDRLDVRVRVGPRQALTAQSAASSRWPRRICASARVASMANSSGSNGLSRAGGRPPAMAARASPDWLDAGQRVVAQREVGAQLDGARARPRRASSCPRSHSARPSAQCAAGSCSSAIRPSGARRRPARSRGSRSRQPRKAFWKCVNDRPACGAREGRVEPHRASRRNAAPARCPRG